MESAFNNENQNENENENEILGEEMKNVSNDAICDASNNTNQCCRYNKNIGDYLSIANLGSGFIISSQGWPLLFSYHSSVSSYDLAIN